MPGITYRDEDTQVISFDNKRELRIDLGLDGEDCLELSSGNARQLLSLEDCIAIYELLQSAIGASNNSLLAEGSFTSKQINASFDTSQNFVFLLEVLGKKGGKTNGQELCLQYDDVCLLSHVLKEMIDEQNEIKDKDFE